jgi:hypothetical protein
MHVLVGRNGVAGFGCVFVVRRRIEFVSHGSPPDRVNAPGAAAFRIQNCATFFPNGRTSLFFRAFLGVSGTDPIGPHPQSLQA